MLWDIETAPIKGYLWGLYKPRPSHDDIIEGSSLLSVAWKWLGASKVYKASVDIDAPRNDKELITVIHDFLVHADVLVHHNGDKFDLRKYNARAVFYDIDPLPEIKTIDTLKIARKLYGFDSNRLDYLGKFLFGEGKLQTSHGLQKRVLDGDKSALKELVKYNKQDVLLLEKVYLKFRPYMVTHPNSALYRDVPKDTVMCPVCGHDDCMRNGIRFTKTRKYQRYQCKACRHNFPHGSALK